MNRFTISTRMVRVTICLTIFVLANQIYAQAQHGLPTHHVPEVVANGRARFLSWAPASQIMHINFILPERDEAALDVFLHDVYNPSSPSYRQFLTVAEFTSRFAPTQQDYDDVISFGQANGMTVTYTPPNRMAVGVVATVAAVEQSLHVRIGLYERPNQTGTFFSTDREPTVDLNLPVWHIGGLDDYAVPLTCSPKSAYSRV